jgi:hypothetical protein
MNSPLRPDHADSWSLTVILRAARFPFAGRYAVVVISCDAPRFQRQCRGGLSRARIAPAAELAQMASWSVSRLLGK